MRRACSAAQGPARWGFAAVVLRGETAVLMMWRGVWSASSGSDARFKAREIEGAVARSLSAELRDEAMRRHPWGRLGTPDEVAAAAVFLLSDDASWITGHVLDVDGGGLISA